MVDPRTRITLPLPALVVGFWGKRPVGPVAAPRTGRYTHGQRVEAPAAPRRLPHASVPRGAAVPRLRPVPTL